MNSATPPSGRSVPQHACRVAGIDFGTVRIGVALADAAGTLASPFAVYRRQSERADAEYFRRLAVDEAIAKFVVGLPVHLSGRESEKSIQAREFGQWLAATTGVAVEFFDERFSTSEAEQLLADAELTKKRRKNRLDAVAAQVLLTAYLESTDKGSSPRAIDG